MTNEQPGLLVAEGFHHDPAVVEAKRVLLGRLAEHQKRITGPRPPHAELVASYAQTLREFSEIRAGNLYFPYLGSGIGRGPLVELADGSIKYDFISGIGVHHLGHSHPKVVAAAVDAGLGDTVMQGNLQQDRSGVDLSRRLVGLARSTGAAVDHCFLTSSGVMAGENALKIAFQKKAPASRVLAFTHCFAGRTITFSQITDKPAYRQGVPVGLAVDYVPFFDPEEAEESTTRAVAALDEHLARYPGQHAAMIFELVQGEGGFNVGSTGFFRALMGRCREMGVAVLVDEVQTFARTSSPFAFDYFGLEDLVDIVWIGKASQVCATFFGKEWAPAPGLLSQTFTASTSAIAAGGAVVRELTEGGYFGSSGRIASCQRFFHEKLGGLQGEDPYMVRGPFGLGAMVAFTPLGGDPDRVRGFVQELFADGVMGFIAGSKPMRVRFLIPVGGVTDGDLTNAWDITEQTLRRSAAAKRSTITTG